MKTEKKRRGESETEKKTDEREYDRQRLEEETRETDRQLLLRGGHGEGWGVGTIAHLPDRAGERAGSGSF